jgi:membrane protease YdiL (CAAX protease family)
MNEAAPQETKPPAKAFPLTRQAVISFSLIVTIIFTIIFSIVTIYFRKQSLPQVFAAGQPLATQIIFGLILGITIAALVLFLLLKARFFSQLRTFIREVLNQVRPTMFDLLLIALLAGFGEELFFRATLQPALGLWLTSLIFALGHTGISFKARETRVCRFRLRYGLTTRSNLRTLRTHCRHRPARRLRFDIPARRQKISTYFTIIGTSPAPTNLDFVRHSQFPPHDLRNQSLRLKKYQRRCGR